MISGSFPSGQDGTSNDQSQNISASADHLLTTPVPDTFQDQVQPWLMACFGPMIAGDREERNHRFLEEALELVQSLGCTASEAHQLVDYTFGRDIGDPAQEVGGVMVTLAALCLANGLDMHNAGETELTRIWTKVEAIRAKQAAKPKHSPLPEHTPANPSAFPEVPGDLNAYEGRSGMTLRDYFAASAPVTLFDAAVACGFPGLEMDRMAAADYRAALFAVMATMRGEYADAMLAERAKGGAA